MMMAAVTMMTFVACGDDNKEDGELSEAVSSFVYSR
jgi:hypothetical protein